MREGLGLNLEQTQKLIMTPELRQAIVILQLSTLELADYIQQELQENPVLEVRDDGEVAAGCETREENDPFDIDWQEYFQDGSDLGYVCEPREELPEWYPENFPTGQPTLQDHLLLQLQIAATNPRQVEIGSFLIGNLDSNGYLKISLKEAAALLKVPQADVWQVLDLIQHFDPPGVGARDLVECLLLQLRQRGEAPAGTEKIIRGFLPDVAEGRLTRIARRLNMSLPAVQAAVDYIRSLDPKPGRSFGGCLDNRYIVPDVIIERVGDEYVVLVNDLAMPRLGINPVYQALLRKEAACDPRTRQFIERKLNAAAWLIRSLEQRRLTVYRVVNCVVKEQREFLDKGLKYLKPLTMRQVAAALGIHESTVSRATANKYVQTPQGVFELKFFFASGVEKRGGAAAAESIKKMISEAIGREDPAAPLTDQQLQEILQQQGIRISRRTVAKYRDEQGIPAAAKRKRY
ncbi:MAG: polymerase sigma-54 factor [Moorella sp. (in: firmicutes)]|uniref:RNA polymerase factor sigma-54 n=1 Tax=Neomoorella thermoacetica TaxID=1525 RepID=UPI0008FA692F|nr:RNA polymerase factor sigma-54 [Moorella thermoacetica]MDN5326630.1 polymerase sigma-54 factor [Moorella sp. (in: firmicutes)]OIQ11514.1 RNA polymerase sigma-54 factor [Moorella thermoacetica]